MSQDIYYEIIGQGHIPVFWGHGWGQNLHGLKPLAESLGNMGTHTLIDFPGFGQSEAPCEIWGTREYADAIAELIKSQTDQKIMWVGHSFGCRVGLQLAAHYPELIGGMCLIAGAGLPRKRPLWHKIYYGFRVKVFKCLKTLIPLGLSEDWLRSKFGSADYKNAGALRDTFIKVVNEDLTHIAKTIGCPVLLIYGANDTETPVEIGERLKGLIQNAELIVMDDHDHFSILTIARHQVVHRIHKFMQRIDIKS